MAGRRGILDHVTIGVSDLARSRAFYERALAPLGITQARTVGGAPHEVEFGDGAQHPFGISTDYPADAPAHVAFGAETVEQVHAFYEAALAAGGSDHGAPGARPEYSGCYYAAFVLDPDGHNIEAVARVRASQPRIAGSTSEPGAPHPAPGGTTVMRRSSHEPEQTD